MAGEMMLHDPGDLVPEAGPAKLIAPAPRGRPDINDLEKIATMLAGSSFCPKHLQFVTKPEVQIRNVFLVVHQAALWGMDPFAVASESYVVGGKLAYQGKLIAGLINARAGLKERLRAKFTGKGDSLSCEVVGTFAKEKTERSITLTYAQAATKNDMWKTDPEQKLYYSAVVKWARRHCPEIVLGITTFEDAEMVLCGPQEEPVQVEVLRNGQENVATKESSLPPQERKSVEGNQTLQEALASQEFPLTGDAALMPDAKCGLELIKRLASARELLFLAKGIPADAASQGKRDAIWKAILNKRGVKTAKDLTNAQALELECKLDEEVAKCHAAAKEANEKK